jgi:hypothetical protein
MHEDKCVNKHRSILKMDYKRQTTVLSVIFFVVGMIFLVPAITQKALAGIHAVAEGTCGIGDRTQPCEFWFVNKALGGSATAKWISEPTKSGTRVTWATTAGGFGDERGYVTYSLGDPAKNQVKLHFDNPAFGRNHCDVIILSGPVSGSCHAGSGMKAEFTYTLRVLCYSLHGKCIDYPGGSSDNSAGGGSDNGGGDSDGGDSGGDDSGGPDGGADSGAGDSGGGY